MNILQSLLEWLKSYWWVLIFCYILMSYIHSFNVGYKKENMYIKSIKTIIKSNSVKLKDILNELDEIIEEIGSNYIILNIIPKEHNIITSELETKMRKEIGNMVGNALSPTYLDKLSLFFSKAFIPDLIAIHVNLYVTQYCINTNVIKSNKPNTAKTQFPVDDDIKFY